VPSETSTGRASRKRFVIALAVITLVGFGVRLGYVVGFKWDEPMVGDQIFYNAEANTLAAGNGFVDPFADLDPTRPLEAADHPPLTVVVLAPFSWVADTLSASESRTNANLHRLVLVVFGTATIGLVGLLGREVGGPRVGLVAAALAAVYPNLWVNDGHVMSETLAVLLVVAALLLTYRLARRRTWGDAAAVGAVCGLAALARAELLLLAPLLAMPALLRGSMRSREHWAKVAVALAATLAVIGPWVMFNLARFEHPTFLSTTDGQTLLGANCDLAYEGPGLGLWHVPCLDSVPGDQSEVNRYQREAAIRYASEHGNRAPVVVAARVGRLWGLYRPADMISYHEGEGREGWVTAAGMWFYYPLVVLAVGGSVLVARRSPETAAEDDERRVTAGEEPDGNEPGWPDRLWPLLAPVVVMTVIAAATYGQTRFRAPAEPTLVVLASVAGVALFDQVRSRVTASTSRPSPSGSVADDDRPSLAGTSAAGDHLAD
jgi:4-amino-4-deoxy-L-arabinose transferase-like glycosyltransferase